MTSITIALETRQGIVTIDYPDNKQQLALHPATTKRWLKLLFNYPRIGPAMRARMNVNP
jgi:hypothetical protein